MRQPCNHRESPPVPPWVLAKVQPMASISYQTWEWVSLQIIPVPSFGCVPVDTNYSWNDLSKKAWLNCRLVSNTNVTVLSNSLCFAVVCHTHTQVKTAITSAFLPNQIYILWFFSSHWLLTLTCLPSLICDAPFLTHYYNQGEKIPLHLSRHRA